MTISPFQSQSVTINLLDGSPETVVTFIENLTDIRLDAPYTSLFTATVQVMQRGSLPLTLKVYLERAIAAEKQLNTLLTEYRSVHQPLREGSLLRLILDRLMPGWTPPELSEITVQSGEALDAPLNPWFLNQEGETQAAETMLMEALGWAEPERQHARTVLSAWQ